ncbi:MAG: hypothetical protein ACI9YT_000544 [Halobacteriales archaeon]|jgi:hypothetical protein
MVFPVTYAAFYVGVLSGVLVTGGAQAVALRTPWAGINRLLRVGDDDRAWVGPLIVIGVLAGLGAAFPWVIIQGLGLHGCYATQVPHTALAGVGYGLVAGVLLAGLYVLAGLVPRKNGRAIASVIGFYATFGLVFGVLHGLVFPIIRVNVGGACPPLV